MFSSLLLSALVLGAPAGGPPPAASPQDDPAIRISLSDDGRYQRGDQAKVQVKTREDGYLLVLNVDPDGRLRVLFPLDPTDDNRVSGGKTYQIVGRGGREGFTVSNRTGQGTVYAAVARSPFRFDGYVAGDHWDFAALDDVRLSEKPENDLNDFVRSIASGDFDYDILGYGVFEQVVYGEPNSALYDNGYDYNGYDYAFDGGYGYGYPYYGYPYYGGTSIFIGLSFGHRHRFFDPFFYSPFFYSPYFYSPFFPAFYNPYYYYPYFYPRPFRPYHVAFFPTRPFYGGYFASPWRNRLNDPLGRGGFEWWRGRQSTFGSGATLASAYHRSFFDRNQIAPARGSVATPVRGTVATTDAAIMRRRQPDMTPGRIESTRSRDFASRPVETGNGPVARRAVDRTESWAARIPNGGRSEVTRRGVERSRDANQTSEPRAVRSAVTERSRGEDVSRVERNGYEGTRVVAPRTYEARRAEDDRPASRPMMEPRRMDGAAPARIERSEPAPRMERSEPAPRVERSQPAPRMESRPSESRGRAEGGSRGGGGGGGGWGGGGGGGNRHR